MRTDPAAAESVLKDLRADAAEAVDAIRRLVYGMRPPALDELGLEGALRQQAATVRNHQGQPLRIEFAQSEGLGPLPAAVEVAAYRIVTEALANAYIAGHRPDFGALRQGAARKVDLPTYPFQHRQYWFREQRVADGRQGSSGQGRGDAVRTETVALLEDGRIEELAALLDGADGSAVDLLKQLAATEKVASSLARHHWSSSL